MTNHGLLVGYDGSPDAAGAIELGARLLPSRDVRIAHLWAEPFAAAELRPRLSKRTETVREMIELLEQEAAAEAERIAAEGVVLAEAAGWKAEPLLKRAYGAQGLELASLAEELEAEMLVVGSRGLTGPRAVLGSVSDQAAHTSPVPTLVVPRLVLTTERDAVAEGPILVGDDGSPGAERARETATSLCSRAATSRPSPSRTPEPAARLRRASCAGRRRWRRRDRGRIAGRSRRTRDPARERGHGATAPHGSPGGRRAGPADLSTDLVVLFLAGVYTALATGLGAIPVFALGERATALRPAFCGAWPAASWLWHRSSACCGRRCRRAAGAPSLGGLLAGVAFLMATRMVLACCDVHVGALHGGGRPHVDARGRRAVRPQHSRRLRDRGPRMPPLARAWGCSSSSRSRCRTCRRGRPRAIPMHDAGFSRWQQFWAAVLTSAPQPAARSPPTSSWSRSMGCCRCRSRSRPERCSPWWPWRSCRRPARGRRGAARPQEPSWAPH